MPLEGGHTAALLALTSSTVKGMEIKTFVLSIHKTKNHTILNMDLKKKKDGLTSGMNTLGSRSVTGGHDSCRAISCTLS